MVGTGRGAQLGILIRGPEVLEQTRRVDTIVLDKTGTVTTGRMTLADVVAAEGEDRAEVLRLAGALEDASEHPIARAIADAARDAGPLPAVAEFASVDGLGVRGVVEGRAVLVGRPRLLAEHSQHLGPELERALADAQGRGGTAVAVWQMSSDLGSVLGPLAAGVLIDQGSFELALVVSAVVVAVCTLPGLRVPARVPSER